MISGLIENKGFNINLDSDGILSFLFFRLGGFKNPINGFNTSSDILLSVHNSLGKVWNDAFVDIFVQNEKTISFDNHIISYETTSINENKINPNILIETHFADSYESYRNKYPLSTCLFILSLLEREKVINNKLNLFQPIDRIGGSVVLCDLILRADGVLKTYGGKYKNNVKNWFNKLVLYSNFGLNISAIFKYLTSLQEKEIDRKNTIIEEFYKNYGLSKDGGYNDKKNIQENIKLLNGLMRSFSAFLDVKLEKKETTLYQYKGLTKMTNEIIDLSRLDTYAFIGHNTKIKYTRNFKLENKMDNLIVYD